MAETEEPTVLPNGEVGYMRFGVVGFKHSALLFGVPAMQLQCLGYRPVCDIRICEFHRFSQLLAEKSVHETVRIRITDTADQSRAVTKQSCARLRMQLPGIGLGYSGIGVYGYRV